MKKYGKTFMFIFFSLNLYCQPTIINFMHINKSINADTFFFDIITVPHNLIGDDNIAGEFISNKKVGDTNITCLKYKIERTSCAMIADGFGHEIIISPNDTVNIFCEPYGSSPHMLKDNLPSPWNFKMYYTGKRHADFAFFDLLAFFDGGLMNTHFNFRPNEESLDQFFKKNNEQLHNRYIFLQKYVIQNNISKAVCKYFEAEIKFGYLIQLLSVFNNGVNSIKPTNVFIAYQDSLKAFNKNDTDLFFSSKNYPEYLNLFTLFFEQELNLSGTGAETQLALSFTSFKTLKEKTIKDYLLTQLMASFYKQRNLNYDSLLNIFHQDCSNDFYKKYIDSLYEPEKGKVKITFEQAMANNIIAPNNNTFKLINIFRGKPVLIDCWASWCVPCLNEIPFSKQFENEFKGKVDFVYLSFDKSIKAWLVSNKQLAFIDNSYLVDKSFHSDLASYFGISTIPRYLAFDKNGLLITKNAPRPSKKDNFKKLLYSMIMEAN